MTTHNDIEQLRKADSALREALRRRAERLPQLPEGFVERTMERLEAAQPAAAQADSVSGQRPVRRRLWLAWAAAAAALVAVAVLVIKPERRPDVKIGAMAQSEATIPARPSSEGGTKSNSSPIAQNNYNAPTIIPVNPTPATTSTLPADTTSAYTIGADVTPSDSTPKFHIDPSKAEKLIAKVERNITYQQKSNSKQAKRHLVLSLHYGAVSQVRISKAYDSDINNLQAHLTDEQFDQMMDEKNNQHSGGQASTITPEPTNQGDKGEKGDNSSDSTATNPTRALPTTRLGHEDTPEGSYTHSLPLTLGVTLGIPLSERWQIETGLRYTYLRSKYRQSIYTSTQHIHYLGIPLHVRASIIGNRHWNVYATAGVTIDIPVGSYRKGNLYSQVLPQRHYNGIKYLDAPFQFSTGIGVGLQYSFTRHLGIFLEPSLEWFIPMGSDIETYRTEHPLQFTLPVGVRITL